MFKSFFEGTPERISRELPVAVSLKVTCRLPDAFLSQAT